MKSLVVVSSNSDSGSSSPGLEVSLSIDQSHHMRVSDKDGAPSSRLARPDHISDDRGLTIVEAGDRDADDRATVASDPKVEKNDDREIDERDLPEEDFVDQDEDVGGDNPQFDHVSPVRVKSPRSGLSRDLFPRDRKLQVLEPVPKGAFSLIDVLNTLASAKAPTRSDARRKDKGIVIEGHSAKTAGADIQTKPAETSKGSALVGDRGEVRRSEKRRDREDDRGRSGSEPKKSKKEHKRKDKALAVPEVMDDEGRSPVEHVADELVGDQAADGASASLSFGPDYDFTLEFRGRGRHILHDPVAFGEYARCIQGHPRGPMPAFEEMVEHDKFMAFLVDLVMMVSNVNFMRTRYEQMLQKNFDFLMENRNLKSKIKDMTKSAEEMVGHINTLGQKNKDLTVEVAKWEDEVQRMMGEKESISHLAKTQMKRLRLSRHETATSFGEYAIEKVGAGLQEKVGAQLQRLRRHIGDSKEMNRISSTVGQIKAFIAFYEEQDSAPEGAVEKLKEDLDEYLKMAAAHNVEKIFEKDFVFPDRASWIPEDELVFPVESPNRVGQYGMGEEWDSAGEENVRGDGEIDPRPSRVKLMVGGSDPPYLYVVATERMAPGLLTYPRQMRMKIPRGSMVELRW
ncbi:hypothetical protein AALP_AA2G064100 [Arabis alpina]|uniref:Uncharacterized protein n=1 Tax=Arabis alpina TaxID=50452 RepID=A0A087HFP1_ARAAL|nr:hypothetical protein AALP_AA2G064100 [Arabis alpina]